jgi:hypothetical protein
MTIDLYDMTRVKFMNSGILLGEFMHVSSLRIR